MVIHDGREMQAGNAKKKSVVTEIKRSFVVPDLESACEF